MEKLAYLKYSYRNAAAAATDASGNAGSSTPQNHSSLPVKSGRKHCKREELIGIAEVLKANEKEKRQSRS